ncbi:SigE family RNA polymerase sigma factor [Nocardioides hwasunensis]|uniref:SigE family RNA polymerase sigma factor n=2 Tax=Nocardioides hwasunensis TaxID=397258 RepID=A0ABR8MFF5_9ACTN|nr:SigE family RNA polymerase sigma factor [Nocardioides hwasunensis]
MEEEMTFEEFMAARWASLYRFAYVLVGDHFRAEDLLQEAMARTCVRWRSIRDKGAAEAYVRRAMVRQASRAWRRRDRETLVGQPPDVVQVGNVAEAADRQAVWDEVRRLPPRMRAALVLRYLEGMSEAEAAEALGVGVGSIKSQTHHALKRLRAAMTEVEIVL